MARPRKHENQADRQRAYLARKRDETPNPVSSTQGGMKPILALEQTSNINDLAELVCDETPLSAKSREYWLRVNDVTWKLTDGTHTITPAVHGKWSVFKMPKALAWVFDAGWPTGKQRYFVRSGRKKAGPFDNLQDAQDAAEYFRGGFLDRRSGAIAAKMV